MSHRLRSAVALAITALTAVSCGAESNSDRAATATTTRPAPPAEFWSQVPQTDAQRYEVLANIRLLDVCALLPRSELARFGEVISVGSDGPYSCDAVTGSAAYGEGTTVSWSADYMDGPLPVFGEATSEQRGDILVRTAPARRGGAQGCAVSAQFPSGAWLYVDLAPATAVDACAAADDLTTTALDRWRGVPAPGVSPDTAVTALTGADPCAVRAELDGTEDLGRPALTRCGFRYRGEEVVISYEYRNSGLLDANTSTATLADRTVHRAQWAPTDPIRSAFTVVGPELPAPTPGPFGALVPMVDVTAKTDAVVDEVMTQIIALFPR